MGSAVVFGLIYMIYLFGFAGPRETALPPAALSPPLQESLSLILTRQKELNKDIRDLEARLGRLERRLSPAEAAGLREELKRLIDTLDLLEARLHEIAGLLPAPPRSSQP